MATHTTGATSNAVMGRSADSFKAVEPRRIDPFAMGSANAEQRPNGQQSCYSSTLEAPFTNPPFTMRTNRHNHWFADMALAAEFLSAGGSSHP